MASSGTQRKLTAILCADVAGYSRLMGADEEATIETLTAYRKVFLSSIASHNGRVVDAKGDAILAEFASVVDAVNSAVEIQRELAERNAELPGDRRMDFRIGINLGDVVVQDDVIYGDGINVAARLEALAEPGGICISRSAYDQVKNKLKLEYEYLGEQQVKNIAEPVRAYRVLSLPGAAAHRVVGAKKKLAVRWRKVGVAIVVVVLLAGAGWLGWNDYRQRTTKTAVAAFEKEAAFPLPDRPSIAVLAFDNLSGDPEQEYFSDGISEEIITRLARLTAMFVIARNSSFVYKGKAVDVRQVGRELGVRYVLEGSVRKAGSRIRVTAQLIDAATRNHMWAGSYDRELNDVFAIQDEITLAIVTELEVKLTEGESARIFARSTENVKALDYFLRGRKLMYRFEKESNVQARELYGEAIKLDASFGPAIANLGWTHMMDGAYGWSKDPALSFQRAEELARQAVAVDETQASPHALLSRVYLFKNQIDQAIAEGVRAMEVAPNNSLGASQLSHLLVFVGRPQEGLVLIKKALRLSPYPAKFQLYNAGDANYFTGRYDEAITWYGKFLKRQRYGRMARLCWQFLIASHIELGQTREARAEAQKFLEVHPDFTIAVAERDVRGLPFKDYSFLDRHIELLRQAGLPE